MKRKTNYFSGVIVAMITASMTLWASVSNDRIEMSFKETYIYKTFLKDDVIKIEAKEGIVTLSGTVSEETHKTLAQETAKGLIGVIRVDNLLMTKADIATENVDTRIGRNVKLTLLLHRNVNALKTDVVVKEGVVTLMGVASSIAQKELTTEYANDIEGVKEVKNEMTVATTHEPQELSESVKMDDVSISAQVKTALLNHRSTFAIKPRVETRYGKVILTGIAKNAAEKSLVTKLVEDIQGVVSVKNEMTIEENTIQ